MKALPNLNEQLLTAVQNLERVRQDWQEARQSAIESPFPDPDLDEAQRKAGIKYNNARQHTLELLCSGHASFKKLADAQISKNIYFQHDIQKRSFSKNIANYGEGVLESSVKDLQDAIDKLNESIDQYNEVYLETTERLAKLDEHYKQLKLFSLAEDTDFKYLSVLQNEFENPSADLPKLLKEISQINDSWLERIENSLKARYEIALDSLDDVFESLRDLEIVTDKDLADYEDVLNKIPNEEEIVDKDFVESIEELVEKSHAKVERKTSSLKTQISTLTTRSNRKIENLHPLMSEVVHQLELLKKTDVNQKDLLAYVHDLTKGLEMLEMAAGNALLKYQNSESSESISSGYLELLGCALVQVDHDLFDEDIWGIAEDILIQIGDKKEQNMFFEKYGYCAVAAKLSYFSDLVDFDFTPMLTLFNTGFSPSGNIYKKEDILKLFKNEEVSAALKRVSGSGALRINQETFNNLPSKYYKALFKLLKYAADTFPLSVRLQWSSLLYSQKEFAKRSKDRAFIQDFFLDQLVASNQYLAIYYGLIAMNQSELWGRQKYVSILLPLISDSLSLGHEGRGFIYQLISSKDVYQLAKTDFEAEFLLASLLHFVSTQWDQIDLHLQAWQHWQFLSAKYPNLHSLLKRSLEGEQFGVQLVLESHQLQKHYDDAFNDLEVRLPRHPSAHTGVWAVHNYYLNNYLEPWMEKLKGAQISIQWIDKTRKEAEKLRRTNDLVKASKLEHKAKSGSSWQASIPGGLRANENRNLQGLLDSFLRILKLRKQLDYSERKAMPPRKVLISEIGELKNLPMCRFSFEKLLNQDLPFLLLLQDENND